MTEQKINNAGETVSELLNDDGRAGDAVMTALDEAKKKIGEPDEGDDPKRRKVVSAVEKGEQLG